MHREFRFLLHEFNERYTNGIFFEGTVSQNNIDPTCGQLRYGYFWSFCKLSSPVTKRIKNISADSIYEK